MRICIRYGSFKTYYVSIDLVCFSGYNNQNNVLLGSTDLIKYIEIRESKKIGWSLFEKNKNKSIQL